MGYGMSPGNIRTILRKFALSALVSGWELRSGEGNTKKPWPGFGIASSSPPAQPSELVSIEVGGEGPVFPWMVEKLLQPRNISKLRLLKLHIHEKHQSLGWLASNADLKSLTTLVLGVERSGPQGTKIGLHDFRAAFLDSLPPLKAIRFVNDIDQNILDSTLRRRGPSLRRLWFPPPKYTSDILFNLSKIVDLQRSYPLLEDLALPIPRFRGDEAEVEMYRTLGKIPRLHKLALALDCEDVDPTSIHLHLMNSTRNTWRQTFETGIMMVVVHRVKVICDSPSSTPPWTPIWHAVYFMPSQMQSLLATWPTHSSAWS